MRRIRPWDAGCDRARTLIHCRDTNTRRVDIDAVQQTDTSVLLDNVLRYLGVEQEGVEAGIVTELVVAVQRTLTDRFNSMSWDDAQQHWPRVVQAWRGSEEGCLFATPLVDRLLALAERRHSDLG